VSILPVLVPLTLVLKTLLRARGLNDVSTGGLGGWTLINLVIAHVLVRPGLQPLLQASLLRKL